MLLIIINKKNVGRFELKFFYSDEETDNYIVKKSEKIKVT